MFAPRSHGRRQLDRRLGDRFTVPQQLRGRLGAPIHGATAAPCEAAPAPGPADPDYKKLWTALGHDPTGMDGLVSRTGLTAAQLSSMLLVMELEGRVVSRHGRYTRTSTAPATVQAEGK